MILNGLGYPDRPLYMTSEFFSKVPCERLLGSGVLPDYLNDDALGRCLDAIYKYGPTELFSNIVFEMMRLQGWHTHLLHVDTTSFSLYGEYPEEGEADIKISLGLPKDGRWDLKRFVLGLVCNRLGVPLFMKSFSGNESDRNSLLEMINELKTGLASTDKTYYVADSALYTDSNLQGIGQSTFWISRVPQTVGEADQLLDACVEMTQCRDARYSYYETVSNYGGISQKWVLVHSKEMEYVAMRTFEKGLAENIEKTGKSLWHLSNQEFFCREDAVKAALKWAKKHPLAEFVSLDTTTVKKKRGRGRPKNDEKLEAVYHVDAVMKVNEKEVERRRGRLGRFILATNDLELDAESLLNYYKEQGVVERGFRFLKDDTFRVSNVYLKKPHRIQALAMIMVLCLMIYSLLEWKLRQKLKETGKTVRSQIRKQVQNPSMKWVFFLFYGVAEILIQRGDILYKELLNMTDELQSLLGLLGTDYEKYYN
ncbi:MAG: Transposase DDE domain protein [Methanocella sp. PtaU1.Bin125]|nr:MAG: Transposase DDE domain protein [Methanocella sp. PtaU1.Bin125]